MNEEIKEIDNSDLMELLETTSKKDFYRLTLDHELVVRLYNWITNLQQENKGLKEELNRMFNRKVNAIKYIGREMIHDALYPASKVDGMKIIELLNGVDEE